MKMTENYSKFFRLFLIVLIINFSPIATKNSQAINILSRAGCGVIGAMESVSYDPWGWVTQSGPMFWGYTVSEHYYYFNNTWNYVHTSENGWYEGYRTYAGHWGEYFQAPGVLGNHYYWDGWNIQWLGQTIAIDCSLSEW